jgi:hypothetical protein
MRDIENMKKQLHSLEKKVGSQNLEDRFADIDKRINEAVNLHNSYFPTPLAEIVHDIAFYEGILDLLVMKKVTDQLEIQQFIDTYGQRWVALAELLVYKKVITPKELHCAVLAYHHMFRQQTAVPILSKEQLFAERIKYIEELLKLSDPLEKLGF